MIEVQLPDGTVLEKEDNVTALDIAAGISEGLRRSTAAAIIEDTVVDAMRPLAELTAQRPVQLTLLTTRDEKGRFASRF